MGKFVVFLKFQHIARFSFTKPHRGQTITYVINQIIHIDSL